MTLASEEPGPQVTGLAVQKEAELEAEMEAEVEVEAGRKRGPDQGRCQFVQPRCLVGR